MDKSERLNLRATPKERKRLEELAAYLDMNYSEVIWASVMFAYLHSDLLLSWYSFNNRRQDNSDAH